MNKPIIVDKLRLHTCTHGYRPLCIILMAVIMMISLQGENRFLHLRNSRIMPIGRHDRLLAIVNQEHLRRLKAT